MDEKLQSAYDALQAAHEAGNTEDARQIADYIETLKKEQSVPVASVADNSKMVVEKESPEALGGLLGTVGAVGAGADVIYSKGRPLVRLAEKALGLPTEAPPAPRKFLDPTAVAEQAIARRSTPEMDVTGSPSAVKSWGLTQHEGDFLGGSEYKEADKIKKEAMSFEKANPTQKVLPGSLLAVPQEEADRLAKQRAEIAAAEDAAKQAEVKKVAQTRAERLGERSALKAKESKINVGKGLGGIAVKVGAPILGGYEAGSQGAQAYNRLTRPDLTASDVASGLTNVVGSGAGAVSMVPSKYRIPAAIIAQGAGAVANFLDKRNPRNEPVVEEKAAGGLAGLAKGGSAIKKGVELAKEIVPRLPRAPAKSKAEIEAIAQRMAPQQLGQFTQQPGQTMSVAGKSRKQFEREQNLMHDIVETPHQLSDLADIDYSKRIGAVATGLPGDKSGVATIRGVAGTKLESPSVQEGGAPYGLHYKAMNPDAPSELWASTGDAARRYMNFGKQVAHQYNTEDILPHYMSMPQGMGYAQHLADVNLKGLRPAGADLGKLTDMMRKGSFKGKTFEDFPGFENMDEVYELMKHNPELRQYFNNRLMVQDFAKSANLPSTYGTDTLHAVTMPGLRDVETGAGGNVIGKLDLRREMTPTAHNTYSPGRDPGLNIPGEVVGSSKYLMPYDLMYADSLQAVRANPKQAPQEFGSLKMTGPRQVIDQQFVDEVEMYREAMKRLTGKAAGGRILKAASELILPAAENAARTQIIGTLPTYKKAAEELAKQGAQGRAIDFGAGLGEGAKALGKDVDTYEPFAKNWNPTFTKPEDIPTDAYNRLTNLNVLNVVPREARDEIVQHIGRVMEPGGLGVLTTRGADVMKAQGRPGPEPMSIITSRDTYQKGFTKQELEDYLKYMLGKGYDINKLNLGPAGVMIKKK